MPLIQPLRRVAQRHWDAADCGIACVATMARVPYDTALLAFRELPGRRRSRSFYTRHGELESMLEFLGVSTYRLRFRSWREIPTHAIVKVNVRANGSWHWVVYDAGRRCRVVHDPKPSKRRLITDFRGLRGSGAYIALRT
ncbi:MAG: cysteine peptidase family C39 domain-containing protein [Acidiferrobacter sp.]